MSEYLRKRLILSVIYFVTAVAVEMITFSLMGLGIFPKYFLFDIFFMVLVAAVVFAVPYSGIATAILTIMLLAQGVVSIFNVSIYRLYGDIFTMELLQYAGEAGNVLTYSLLNQYAFFIILPLMLAAIAASVVLSVKIKTKIERKRAVALCMAVVLCLCSCFSLVGYALQKNNLEVQEGDSIIKVDDKDLFDTIRYKISFLRKFGTFALYWKNAALRIPVGGATYHNMSDLEKYFFAANSFQETKYFGADRENNVVVVMMESIDSFFIHPKYTPTLYALQQGGINLSNYHSQAKTNVSELAAILGNYPQNDTFVQWGDTELGHSATNNYYPFALTNILRYLQYDSVNYFHPSQGVNYIRNQTHTTYFGFDNAYFMEDYPTNANYPDYEKYIYDWSMPEKWFIDSAKDDMFPTDKKFFTFFTTINAHGEYGGLGSSRAAEFHSCIDDADFAELNGKGYYGYYKNGLAESMCVDEGVQYILEILEARKLTSKTTLVFYADHGAYYHELQYQIKNAGTTDSPAYKVPAFIVSPNVKHIEITKFTTAFDIVPTLFQLLGIRYNPSLYYGNPVFDKNETVINSMIGGIFNDKFYSYDGIEILYRREGATDADLSAYQTAVVALQEKTDKVGAIYSEEFSESLRSSILTYLKEVLFLG